LDLASSDPSKYKIKEIPRMTWRMAPSFVAKLSPKIKKNGEKTLRNNNKYKNLIMIHPQLNGLKKERNVLDLIRRRETYFVSLYQKKLYP
jgi:hypothetical protein